MEIKLTRCWNCLKPLTGADKIVRWQNGAERITHDECTAAAYAAAAKMDAPLVKPPLLQ